MSIFGSFFHKKKQFDDSSLPSLANSAGPWSNQGFNEEEDLDPNRIQSTRAAEMTRYEVPEFNQAPRDLVSGERFRGGVSEKDVQLILSKLDLISSRLDNLNRRIEAMEATGKRNSW